MTRRMMTVAVAVSVSAWAASPALAQGGLRGVLNKANKAVDAWDSMTFSEEEERTIGQEISAMLRDRFGVVQDREVHKYVTLVGKTLTSISSRADLGWTFIVLDTDGINAFAAPGGFIHITKGALALIQNEAELADVLGHEVIHVTAKHTLNAIRKQKVVGATAGMTRQQFVQQVAKQGYGLVIENGFDRAEEEQSDKEGVVLANKAGYAPTGLAGFLTRLADRNKGLKERSGLIASYRDTQTRLGALERVIKSQKLTAAALVAARYDQAIDFSLLPLDQVPQGGAPAASTSSTSSRQGGSGALGLGGLNPLASSKSSGAVSSAASRGVNPDRDAKGGPNKALVVVTVTAAEIAAFRKGIV